MTIKEVEQLLEIPRATVRYYEKEGLLEPTRSENGYRDYSAEDVRRIAQIIVLRKIGLPVNEIEDLFDGARTMDEALEDNLENLKKQMSELEGAMNLSRRMKEDRLEVKTFDPEVYRGLMAEEEKRGNAFFDIARDIAEVEKKVLLSHVTTVAEDGTTYDSWPAIIRNAIIVILAYGCINCLFEKDWSIANFLHGVGLIASILACEGILSIPIYFLGRKIPWVAKHHVLSLFLLSSVLFALVVIVVLI